MYLLLRFIILIKQSVWTLIKYLRSKNLSRKVNLQSKIAERLVLWSTCKQVFDVLIRKRINWCVSLRKEVIQPQVPLGLPCYDFTPVMNHTVVIAIPERLS